MAFNLLALEEQIVGHSKHLNRHMLQEIQVNKDTSSSVLTCFVNSIMNITENAEIEKRLKLFVRK